MPPNRVVITGIGAVTPAGRDLSELWKNIGEGSCGIRNVTLDGIGVINAGIVDENFGCQPDRCIALAVEAARQALSRRSNYADTACYLSAGKGGMSAFEQAHSSFIKDGWRSIPEKFFENFLTGSPSIAIAKQFGLGGTCLNFPTACVTGLTSIAIGAGHVYSGRRSSVLTGAVEASITPLMTAGFRNMQVLAKEKGSPSEAMRPFDRSRDGFVIGEGAGAVLLESLQEAQKRSAPILAEVIGWASGCDHRNMIKLGSDCELTSNIIYSAIRKAGINPADIDYINAHGTATIQNDIFETSAIKKALGSAASKVMVSSTKPFTGHLLGASGAIETIITVMAINSEYLPPTPNLHEPDPQCDLVHVPPGGLQKHIDYALVLNYGFGGHAAAIVLKRFVQNH